MPYQHAEWAKSQYDNEAKAIAREMEQSKIANDNAYKAQADKLKRVQDMIDFWRRSYQDWRYFGR